MSAPDRAQHRGGAYRHRTPQVKYPTAQQHKQRDSDEEGT